MNYRAVFDIGGSFIKFGAGNTKKGLVYSSREMISKGSRIDLYGQLEDLVNELMQRYHVNEIVISTPGNVNTKTGEILGSCPNITNWKGANPKQYLMEQFGLPVYIDNDANLMAYGEYIHTGEKIDVLGVTIGTGIGSGFICNGHIFRGQSYSGMEMGHTQVMPEGRYCKCHKHGCVEAYCSAESILAQVQESHPEFSGFTIAEILDMAKSNTDIFKIVYNAWDMLAIGLANTSTLLNPNLIVIGGGVSEIESFDINYIRERVFSYLLPEHRKGLRISLAKLGNRAALWGSLHIME